MSASAPASAQMACVPELDLDLFGDQSLRDPFSDYRQLRDAGPVVHLRRPDVFAIGRFADVQAALRDSARLISGEGVGFSDIFNAPKGLNVIQSDGDLHRRLRSTVARPLAPSQLREMRPELKSLVATRIDALKGKGWFDAMSNLAAFLPIEAVSHLVGLPNFGREHMLEWAAAAFNLVGPDQNDADVASLREASQFIASLTEDTVRDGSWAGELLAAASSGRLSMPEALGAISAYIIPSLDTTILANGHLLASLARDPASLDTLKQRPELIPSAVLESLRRDSVIRWFSRVAAEDYTVGGATIPKGARVMLLYGCANRDERHYANPDRFDITRDARDHLAWGTGSHMCVGMHLARIEMEVMVEALVEANLSLKSGSPLRGANRGLFGFEELPFRLDGPAQTTAEN